MKKIINLLFLLIIAINSFAQDNLVINGDFQNGADRWLINQAKSDSGKYLLTFDDGLTISQTVKTDKRVDISQDITIEKNTEYIVSFDYKATHKKLRIWSYFVSENGEHIYNEGADNASADSLRTNNKYLDDTDEWITYTCSFVTPDVDTIPTFRLEFRRYAQKNSTISIKNVKLLQVKEPVIPTAINESAIIDKPLKVFENGKIYILKDNRKYNLFGLQE